jgi:Meckel syndrome type 1 protein
MRVTCPSCHAVYEAPDAEIGAGGRVVECSACGARWMQPGAAAEPPRDAPKTTVPGLAAAAESMAALRASRSAVAAPQEAPETPAEDAPAPDDPAEAKPDPGAAAWRATPAAAGPGVDTPPRPVAAAAGPAADLPPAAVPAAPAEPEPEPEPKPEPEPAAETPEETPRRRNRVASIDAQSLSAELRGAAYEDDDAPERRSGGGAPFAIGFLLAVIVCGVGAVAYLQPTIIGDAFPDAYPWLDRWAGVVDQGRAAVDRAVAALANLASPLIDRIR